MEQGDIPVTIAVKRGPLQLFFKGVVGDAHQLLLLQVEPGRLGYFRGTMRLSRVSELLQYRLYDYMEALGTGDGTAAFVKEYNTCRHLLRLRNELTALRGSFLLPSST